MIPLVPCSSVSVLCVHRCPGHGDLCRVPAAELRAEVSRAAGDDRRLLPADRGVLHVTVCPLRQRPPQHRVSVSTSPFGVHGSVRYHTIPPGAFR